MNKRQFGLILTLSILLSSCGLIDKFKSQEDSTDSVVESSKTEESTAPSDDLFTNLEATESKTDAPANITAENTNADAELKELQNEFNGTAPTDSSVAEVKTEKTSPIKVREEAPVIDHSLINESENIAQTTGNIKNYKVKNGDTLMQVAFKLYGDISKWKDLKELNGDKLSSSSRLKAGTVIKYDEPMEEFVWNPVGTPYLIQTGETLGIISNNVYNTPKKWKTIWDNNRPLIKNPNLIYAGFTLYYKSEGMANYVTPRKEIELSAIDRLGTTTEEIQDIRSSTERAPMAQNLKENISNENIEEVNIETEELREELRE